ncbi:hypothetical protein LZ24_01758 [Desulfobotulus alkaliphilus]|uniref:Uncharacterized protein n=1 Tax=Desulfobotulus alkaliphilus TaxID=622671 RepID=A0A562RRS1_9BACT|nr:hypothetical protein LZ24_01758 [Desulfobotulus alkaliphilus]
MDQYRGRVVVKGSKRVCPLLCIYLLDMGCYDPGVQRQKRIKSAFSFAKIVGGANRMGAGSRVGIHRHFMEGHTWAGIVSGHGTCSLKLISHHTTNREERS